MESCTRTEYGYKRPPLPLRRENHWKQIPRPPSGTSMRPEHLSAHTPRVSFLLIQMRDPLRSPALVPWCPGSWRQPPTPAPTPCLTPSSFQGHPALKSRSACSLTPAGGMCNGGLRGLDQPVCPQCRGNSPFLLCACQIALVLSGSA